MGGRIICDGGNIPVSNSSPISVFILIFPFNWRPDYNWGKLTGIPCPQIWVSEPVIWKKGRLQGLNFGLERHQVEWKHLCCVECSWLLWVKHFKQPNLACKEVFHLFRSEMNRFNPVKAASSSIFCYFQAGVGSKSLESAAWCSWRAAGKAELHQRKALSC